MDKNTTKVSPSTTLGELELNSQGKNNNVKKKSSAQS